MYSIYKHTCPNGKIYIGITSQEPEQRWNNGFGYQKNHRFFKDIVHFGWSNFLHEIIVQVESQAEATRIEKILITSHKSNNPDYGYNVQCGTLAQCTLHSDVSTERSPQSIMHSDITTKDVPPIKVDGRGKAGMLKVAQYSKTGTLIATYNSMKDASSITGVNHGDICSCCRGYKSDGTPKHSAGGYVWKYVE